MHRRSTVGVTGTVVVAALVAGLLPLAIGRDPVLDPDRSTRHSATETPVTGASLERRVEGTVRERGVLESAAAVTLVSEVPGSNTIVRLVAEGTRVAKGDVVVVLDSSSIEEQRSQ
jgi:multidrug efflux pump subunit AcrA (membrane-fusion protein)